MKRSIFKLNKTYLLLTILLFIIEVLIALFVKDKFIRPTVGDVLVVMLIYCFLKSFFVIPVIKTAIGVLLFAWLVELLQYFRLVELLGLQDCKPMAIILGTSFSWGDIVAYTVGILLIIGAEKAFNSQPTN